MSTVEFREMRMADVMSEFHDGPHATPPAAEAGPVYLGIKNLTDGGSLDLSNVRHIAPRDFVRWTKRVTPQAGDLVFTYEATLHRYALIPADFEGCLGRRLALIRPRLDVLEPKYLHLLMLGPEWRQTVEERVISGATVDRIPILQFPDFPIRVPPLRTQRRIASLLGALDELIELNERRIELLEGLARTLYREWFVRFRFPGHQDVKLVDSEFGPIPPGWTTRRINEFATVIRGRAYRRAELSTTEGIPFLNLKCVRRGGGFRRSGLKRYTGSFKEGQRVVPGDVLVAVTDMTQERRIVAQAIRVPDLGEPFGIPSLDLAVVKPTDPTMRVFVYATLRYSEFSETLRPFANGANVLHLAVERISEFPVLIPEAALLEKCTSALSSIFDESELLEVQNRHLAATRDLLLPRLVTGRLDISGIDLGVLTPPEPEPA